MRRRIPNLVVLSGTLAEVVVVTVTACSDAEKARRSLPDAATDSGEGTGGAPVRDAGSEAAAHDVAASPPDSSGGDAADAASDAAADAPLDASLGPLLSETGLYLPGGETLAPGIRAFTPRFELWSDGATKRRFLYLPPGTRIDTSSVDAWVFPVGTKVWKEFTRDGVRAETRLLEKVSLDPTAGWTFVAYAWNAAQTRAVAVPSGVRDALGTEHDVPAQADCFACHSGVNDFLLGVSAVQLAWDTVDGGAAPPLTVADLFRAGLLTDPAPTTFPVPGDDTTARALGVLHANCGHCHRPESFVWERTQMDLHLSISAGSDAASTAAYVTAVGVPPSRLFSPDDLRVAPGEPSRSAVYFRMASRDPVLAMPPIATEKVDMVGTEAVRSWISGL